ncbi:hypothetical protein DTF36_17610 [Salmonella enterica subsp. enterica]|nr:hypothetical protein [Salmonella enterica subsp. enterica]MKP46092.1 hypothetical protein [Salmonella enterica subsp. enterica]
MQSQIIRAFDAFVMWKKEAEGSYFDLKRCFEVNKVTDVAADVRSFLVNKELYTESDTQWNEKLTLNAKATPEAQIFPLH